MKKSLLLLSVIFLMIILLFSTTIMASLGNLGVLFYLFQEEHENYFFIGPLAEINIDKNWRVKISYLKTLDSDISRLSMETSFLFTDYTKRIKPYLAGALNIFLAGHMIIPYPEIILGGEMKLTNKTKAFIELSYIPPLYPTMQDLKALGGGVKIEF